MSGVPARVAALVGGAIAVLGALVYLSVVVRSGPVAAPIASSDHVAEPVAPAPADAEPSPPRSAEPPAPPPPAQTVADAAAGELDLPGAMDLANRFYDRQEHDAAQEAALQILEHAPGNVRMLRIVVSTACMMGEPDKAQRYWTELPGADRAQMSSRCARFGVAFKE